MVSSDRVTIPSHWRQETEECIANQTLDTEARSDIVRTLITLMVAKFGPKLEAAKCQAVARQLILKYPFMADDLGCGYVRCFTMLLSIHVQAYAIS